MIAAGRLVPDDWILRSLLLFIGAVLLMVAAIVIVVREARRRRRRRDEVGRPSPPRPDHLT